MTMLEAARMGDRVAHSHALFGFIAGLVAGVIIGALIAAATIVTGGGALLLIGSVMVGAGTVLGLGGAGALFGMELGATWEGSGDPIATGASTVFIGRDRKPAARATIDRVTCDAPQLIAEGSQHVFIQGGPAARRTDHAECGGHITEGWRTVFIGKEAGRYLPVEDEVPGWLVAGAQWAVRVGGWLTLAGTAIMSGIVVAGVGYFASTWASELAGEHLGDLGQRLFGERGRIIFRFVGEQAAGFLAGRAVGHFEGRLQGAEIALGRRALANNPELAARLASSRGANPLQIGARQNVAAAHYRATRSYTEFANGYRARPGNATATEAQVQTAYRRENNSHMAGIDFRQPVRVVPIEAGTTLYTYNKPGAQNAGSYFTREPTAPTEIGISENNTYKVGTDAAGRDIYATAPRELYTVKTQQDTVALESTASSKLDNWTVQRLNPDGTQVLGADGRPVAVVAEARGGGQQLNINTAREAANGQTQGQLFEPGNQGVHSTTGRNASEFADPATNQNSNQRPPDGYNSVPISGDAPIRGPGVSGVVPGISRDLGGDGDDDGGPP